MASATNKVITYGLLCLGLALLLGGRLTEALRGDLWTGGAMILIGLSCLTDPLLPGGTKLTPQQVAMIRHIGVPYRDGAEKIVSIAVGICLLIGGLYFALR